MDYQIEELSEKHLQFNESFFETLRNLVDSPTLDQEKMKDVLTKMHKQWTVILVAVNEHGIIGTTGLLIEQKFIRWWVLAGHIEDVAVRKWFEGKGIAGALLTRAIEIAKEKWCYKIILDCGEKMIPFYEKFGFKHDGAYMVNRF